MSLKFTEFPAELKERIAESLSFQQALKRLQEGKAETPRSWVYEDKSSEWIKDTWSKQLLKVCEEKDLKVISEWDLDKLSKFAPQGGVAPFDKRLETLKEYWAHLSPSGTFQTREWKRAQQLAIKHLGFNKTGTPISVEAVVNRGFEEDKLNTSSGDPLFRKRKSAEAIDQAIRAAKDGTWNTYLPVLGSRASMGKTGEEARWIFMFPMSVNLVEQSFMYPVMDYIRSRLGKGEEEFSQFFAPWDGYDRVQAILSSFRNEKVIFFGSDYTKMDQHFNFYHAVQVYEVIKHYFQPQFQEGLFNSIHYTFHCSVVTPRGLLLGPHALPSGSGWTNFLESVFNLILWFYIKITSNLKIKCAMGIGDDQLIMIEGKHDLKKLAEFVVNKFKLVGMDANPSKQEVAHDMAAFLQRRSYTFWSVDGKYLAGVYPTCRALTSEIFPEFYHNEKQWSSKTFALRCLMIAENCVNHPAFREFVLFIAQGNSNIIDFAKSNDKFILREWKIAKSIANFVPTYNQEKANVSPLRFKSIAILREYYK
nr:RNA-dependent RNA polymerase [Marmot picobirnavirus]